MHNTGLGYYGGLDLNASDLVEFYKLQGFNVCHLPWENKTQYDSLVSEGRMAAGGIPFYVIYDVRDYTRLSGPSW